MNNQVKYFLNWVSNKELLSENNWGSITRILAIEEGVKFQPYKDTRGRTTIGIGRNLDDNPLTREEIYYLFQRDVRYINKMLNASRLDRDLSHIRTLALINLIFNLGFTKFLSFKKMIAALENKDYKLAADEIRDSKYWRDNDTHNRAERIAKMIETDKMDSYYENYLL